MYSVLGVFVAAVAASTFGRALLGQPVCGTWTADAPRSGVHGGGIGSMTAWDPDGAGPLPERLVVSGSFTGFAGVATERVAGWNGTQWLSMGAGLTNGSTPGRLLTVGPNLLMIGASIGGTPVTAVVYRGGVWEAINAPVGTVTAAASSGSELLMIGSFTARPGLNSTTIARWRPDTGWSSFGTVSTPRAVTSHAGTWYVSGLIGSSALPGVAAATAGGVWQSVTPLGEESEWSAAPSGLFSANGELWAFGRLASSSVVNGALRLENGAWVERNEGVGAGSLGLGQAVEGVLYRAAGPAGTPSLLMRGASAWEPVTSTVFDSGFGSIAVYGGALHIVAATGDQNGPLVRVGDGWRTVGNGFAGLPRTAVTWRGRAVMGGSLSWIDGAAANGLMMRGSTGWRPFATPLEWTGGTGNAYVQAMVVHGDELVVSGPFVGGGDAALSRVAAWDGVSWRSLGDDLPVVPSALASDGGVLYAAGFANTAGDGAGIWLTVWKRVASSWERIGTSVAMGGTYYRALLGVRGGTVAVSSIEVSLGNTTTPFQVYVFDGGAWVGHGLNHSRLTGFVQSGPSLLVAGYQPNGGGPWVLSEVSVAGITNRPIGSFAISNASVPTYAFAYRGGWLLSGWFHTGNRLIVAPATGAPVAVAEPDGFGYVSLFADDGFEGFGLASTSVGRIGLWRYSCSCGAGDFGSAGGALGGDGELDNNDFIVFVTLFFDQHWRADIGAAGGEAGSDGAFDNNDFIVFIDRFFAGC